MKRPNLLTPLFTIGLFLFFVSRVFAQAVNLTGTWVSEMGYSFRAEQSGDSISLTVEAGKNTNLIGKVGLTGTITGNSFVGQVYETAEDCPNLGRYIPATGTVSENSIELTYDAPKYYPDGCAYSGNYETIRTVLTRVPKEDKDLPKEEAPGSTPDESWKSVKFRDSNKVNDWIMENFGDYEMKPVPISETRVQGRVPQIKPDQPAKDSALHQMIEEQLKAGAIATSYEDGVLIENLFEGKWIFISPNALVTYSPGMGRHSYSVQQGEVEVKEDVSNTDVETPNAIIKSKDTHYWVSYDQEKKETTVGVYEGEVEIRAKDGTTIAVSSSGGGPGVMVISQKLSIVKLAILSLVMVAAIGGAVFVLRKVMFARGEKRRK